MRPRTLLFALLALALGGGTIVMVQKWMASKEATMTTTTKPAEAPRIFVLVAAQSVSAGDFITPGTLRWQSWPDNAVPRSYITRNTQGTATAKEIVGGVARKTIAEGEPILGEMIVRAGDRGFLAAVLWPGMRAVSVPVNEAASVSGLVFPGDRIDVILTRTHRLDANNTSFSSETLLENVRVLAIGTHTATPEAAPATGRGATARRPARAIEGKTATLELAPDQVEAVMVAQSLGRLSLSLRSLSDEEALIRFRNSTSSGPKGDRPAGAGKEPGSGPGVALTGDRRPAGEAGGKETEKRDTPESDDPLHHDKPVRGTTVTTDAEVSRSARRAADPKQNVTVLRGGKSQNVPVE